MSLTMFTVCLSKVADCINLPFASPPIRPLAVKAVDALPFEAQIVLGLAAMPAAFRKISNAKDGYCCHGSFSSALRPGAQYLSRWCHPSLLPGMLSFADRHSRRALCGPALEVVTQIFSHVIGLFSFYTYRMKSWNIEQVILGIRWMLTVQHSLEMFSWKWSLDTNWQVKVCAHQFGFENYLEPRFLGVTD